MVYLPIHEWLKCMGSMYDKYTIFPWTRHGHLHDRMMQPKVQLLTPSWRAPFALPKTKFEETYGGLVKHIDPFKQIRFKYTRSTYIHVSIYLYIYPQESFDPPMEGWMNLNDAGVFWGPQNGPFWGVRILRTGEMNSGSTGEMKWMNSFCLTLSWN